MASKDRGFPTSVQLGALAAIMTFVLAWWYGILP